MRLLPPPISRCPTTLSFDCRSGRGDRVGAGLAACGSSAATGLSANGSVSIVAAENQYGNVAAQIGGRYVAGRLGGAQPEHRSAHLRGEPRAWPRRSPARQLVIQNGVGYDTFMDRIESASPSSGAQGHRRPAPARAP